MEAFQKEAKNDNETVVISAVPKSRPAVKLPGRLASQRKEGGGGEGREKQGRMEGGRLRDRSDVSSQHPNKQEGELSGQSAQIRQ